MAVSGPLPEAQVTPRLLLRPWRPDDSWDVTAAYQIYSHPLVWSRLGAQPAPCADLAEAHDRLTRFTARSDGVAAILAVVPFGGGDVPVGSALLVPLPRSDGAETGTWEIGWHLHPEVWGRGFATEAGAAMAARAAAAGLDSVHAVVHPDNPASLAVCDRLGMTRLGSTAQWYGVDLVDHHLPLAAGVPAPRRPTIDLTDAPAPLGARAHHAG